MSGFKQHNRPIQITVDGLSEDSVSITGVSGAEAVSRLSRFTCDLSVPNTSPVTFAQLLGKAAVVSVYQTGDQWRYIRGLFSRLTEVNRTERFTEYTAELVPNLWQLTRIRRSRLFQHETTEDIIRKVVGGLYPMGDAFKLEGTYFPRNICAQYEETDFDFFSRLLEEEGWYYYFTNGESDQKLVISDNPRGHQPVPISPTLTFVGEASEGGRVTRWEKTQELRTASFALTDHSFEMPPNPLEAVETLSGSVAAGSVSHPVKAADDPDTEVTAHPGGYARWRDGIAPGGGDRADDLQHVFEDNKRLARVRAEEELAGAVEITGGSSFSQLTAGHKFTLTDHPDADGEYVVTSVRHSGAFGAAQSGTGTSDYSNTFTAIPAGVTFRPPRDTPRPLIRGTQTAVVVGGDGAEIDPDKYGRVKVWFRWDPAGQRALDSSCWVRVATPWAGKQWGMIHIPRVGDEVLVAFENGNPDCPVIIGSLYNADNMPIYTLPDNKTQSGIKTHSSTGGTTQNFNELRFEDKKGQELVHIHAERNMSTVVEVNRSTTVGNNSDVTIGTDAKADPKTHGKSTTTIFGDTKMTVTKGDYTFDVQTGKASYHVKGKVDEQFEDEMSTLVKKDVSFVSSDGTINIQASKGKLIGGAKQAVELKSNTDAVKIVGTTKVELSVGASSITMDAAGTIEIKGVNVTISGAKVDVVGAAMTSVKGAIVKINC
jgi:type VI secretion system secreted protein VgrG